VPLHVFRRRIQPRLQARLEQVRKGFDIDYCLQRTKTILDGRNYADAEWLDVAHHFAQVFDRRLLGLRPEAVAAVAP